MIHEIVFSFSDWRMTSPGHSKHMCWYYWNYSCKIFSCSLNTGEISAGFLQMTCYHLPCFDIILWLIGSCSLKKIIYLTAVGLSCSSWTFSFSFFLVAAFGIFSWDMQNLLVVSCGILCYSMWDLISQPEMEPGPPALGVQSLSQWTSRKFQLISCMDH